jgi:dTDP-4-dehydrorhamnose reductase
MRILVTGWHSQIARALVELAPSDPAVTALSVARPARDLLKPSAIAGSLLAARPDVIVNAAAWTQVDRAEQEQGAAFAQNRAGAAEIARVAADRAIPIVHMSSVYVFDGRKDGPYTEDDEPNPLSVYGRTRLAGERAIAAANPRHVILRTGWVYSGQGKNFVTRMLARARAGGPIAVVDDQVGSPTYAPDLAATVLAVAARLAADGARAPRGVFHAAGDGRASWFDLAQRLFVLSAARGGPAADPERAASRSFATSAPRLVNACLDSTKLGDTFGERLPHWSDGLGRCVAGLIDADGARPGAGV